MKHRKVETMDTIDTTEPIRAERVPRGTEQATKSPVPFPRKVVGILVIGLLLTSLAFAYEIGTQSGGAQAPAGPGAVADFVNLTVEINATTGAPQYVPANFSVVAGTVAITIHDTDSPANWTACMCAVTGTVGLEEWVNGTRYHTVPSSNVAHTFSIPALHLNVLSPGGGSTVFFQVVFPAGTYTWYCMAPCGSSSNGYSGFPMGTPGYMEGSVAAG